MVKFNERFKNLRIEANYTQLQVAKLLNTTQRKVSYWEQAKVEPDLETLWKIAELFNVSIDFLIGKIDY